MATPKLDYAFHALPGQCFFIRYDDDGVERQWIGVICDEDMLNHQLRCTRPVTAKPASGPWIIDLKLRTYPVLLLGRDLLKWIHISKIYELRKEQESFFTDRPQKADFQTMFKVAEESKNSLAYWKSHLLNDADLQQGIIKSLQHEQQNRKRAGTALANSNSATASSSGRSGYTRRRSESAGPLVSEVEESEDERKETPGTSVESLTPSRKRAKTTATTATTATTGATESRVRPASSDTCTIANTEVPPEGLLDPDMANTTPATATDPAPVIKVEGDDEQIVQDVVNIQVGRNHDWVSIAKTHLSQSPFLTENVRERPGKRPDIMLPEFVDIALEDFVAVKSFLETGDYLPKLVKGLRENDYILEGLGNLKKKAGEELVRCGRIYSLATEFRLPNLQKLVMNKARYGFPKGWEPKFFLILTQLAFSETWPYGARGAEDEMRAWIVKIMAENFRELAQASPKDFWDTLEGDRGLHAGVFKKKFEMVTEHGGRTVVKIEDD